MTRLKQINGLTRRLRANHSEQLPLGQTISELAGRRIQNETAAPTLEELLLDRSPSLCYTTRPAHSDAEGA